MWQFVAVDEDGVPLGDLVDITKASVTWRLDAAGDAEVYLNGLSGQAELIDELITDVLIYRDRDLLFRGRVVATTDTIDAEDYELRVGIVDYRGLLARRTLWPGTTAIASGYTSVDQAAIAWDLINDSQALTGGNWGITQGTGNPTGVTRTRSVGYYVAGKNLAEALDELGRVINGFDWEIDPTLAFNVYYPTRGSAQDFAVTFDDTGGNVNSIERSADTTTYANAIRVSGESGVVTSTQTAGDIATRPEGRIELQHSDTNLKSASAVSDRAQRLLADASLLQPAYACTLAASAGWNPSLLWLGDTCPIRIRRGRLDVDTTGRVVEVSVELDENRAETVSLAFDRPPMKERIYRDIRRLAGRVEDLARR